MNPVRVEAIEQKDFRAKVVGESGRTVVILQGNADMSAHEGLRAFLAALDQEARQAGLPAVHIDLRSLHFMSSSCIKHFVSLISSIQELPPERRYKLVFIVNTALHWQERTLRALEAFAKGLVVVEKHLS